MIGAFQRNAFQNNAFQVSSVVPSRITGRFSLTVSIEEQPMVVACSAVDVASVTDVDTLDTPTVTYIELE